MTYRIAKSLEVLLHQIDGAAPDRDRQSDGWIGDASHKTRDSDHNPWVIIQSGPERGTRIVTALDITHDRPSGVDCGLIVQGIVDSRDSRVKYIIWNSRICSGDDGPKSWTWRSYRGTNPHNRHCHISVEDSNGDPKGLFDLTDPWALHTFVPVDEPPLQPVRPTLRRGDSGEFVKELQRMLSANGYTIKVDGVFGPKTDKAVRLYQKSQGLVADGIVGPYTWERLES